MNGLKLITGTILLFLVLLSMPFTEFCIYEGSVDIVSHTINNVHNHCSGKDNQKSKPTVQQNQKCCINIKLSETQGNILPVKDLLDLQLLGLPIETQNYFKALNKHLGSNSEAIQSNFKLFPNAFEDHFQNNPSFLFTSTILLLI